MIRAAECRVERKGVRSATPEKRTAEPMIDRATLRKCLDFVDGDYGFLLVNNLADGRPRCRVNGWRAVRGLL